ncbi:MAG: CBS domain-containing protein [Xenococcaceae cyanobacterium MO_207.B15]|nr:CBS domain-containing protein [Xenococcaceae cyanobacterium MO_207.B15]
MKASDIMTKEVLMIHSWATVAEALALMQNKKLRSLIVEPNDEDDAYGIVTETDIVYGVTAQEKDPSQVRIEQIMTKPCIVVNPDLSLTNVARLFANTGIQKAPVIKDKLLGIISVTDILMKIPIAQLSPSDIVSQKIGEAILHSRVCRDPEDQIAQESEIGWNVVEELESQEAK